MIMAHLDVVPAGSGWTSDPLYAHTQRRQVDRPRRHGRQGSRDLCALCAVRRQGKRGIPFKRKVRIFFGCDEERNMSCITRYKQTEPEPTLAFTPDGQYPVINSEKEHRAGHVLPNPF